ncbi:MAG: hypothetical protein WBD95_01940 [Xanthobacteraceae bacterium]
MPIKLLGKPAPAIGAIVMAGGSFGAASLQQLPGGAAMTRPLTALLAVTWLAIGFAILREARKSGMSVFTDPLIASFGIGTWVAATMVLARMINLAMPETFWMARIFFVLGFALWVWFIPRALANLVRLAARPELHPNGIILLSTVATQAVAVLAFRLFPGVSAIHSTAVALLGLGIAFYVVALCLVLRRYAEWERWRIATDWDNTNCILHGAISITGVAAVVSGLFTTSSLLALWLCDIVVFVLVELIDTAHLAARLREFGCRRGLLVYDTSQWARNFTFAMFYAFNLDFAAHYDLGAGYRLVNAMRGASLPTVNIPCCSC